MMHLSTICLASAYSFPVENHIICLFLHNGGKMQNTKRKGSLMAAFWLLLQFPAQLIGNDISFILCCLIFLSS